jgi:phosphate transport system permease protein
VGILVLLLFEALPAFAALGLGIFGPLWDPNRNLFGIAVFIAGTLWVSSLAILMAVPLGVGGALFLSEYCPNRLRLPLRMIMELMAAIPSIVYGLWALKTLVPALRNLFQPSIGHYSGFGVLAGSIILGVMLLPTVVAVSEDAMRMVPDTLREASYALGASRTETARRVVLSGALPGIGAAILLSLGRAVGETMAVLMVTGNSLVFPVSIFDQTYVMTSVLANQLGYALSEPIYRSALFAVALVLLLLSVLFTVLAKLAIRRGMRRQGLK